MSTALKGFPSCSPGIQLDQEEQGTTANELLYEKIKGGHACIKSNTSIFNELNKSEHQPLCLEDMGRVFLKMPNPALNLIKVASETEHIEHIFSF